MKGLALQFEVNLPFFLCFTFFGGQFSKYKPLGGLYLEGRFNGRFFFALPVWKAYIWRGLYMKGLIFRILRYVMLFAIIRSMLSVGLKIR